MITTLSDYIAKNGDREIDSEKLDEVLQIKRSKVCELKEGDDYWYLDRDGDVDIDYWMGSPCDYCRYEIGNVFPIEEDAQAHVEYLKTRAALKRYAQEHNERKIDWNDFSSSKFSIKYDCIMNKFLFECTVTGKSNNIYFTSEKITQAAIEEIGEERIKQYLLYEG